MMAIWERLVLASGAQQQMDTLNEILIPRLRQAANRLDSAVLAASRMVAAARGRTTVDALAGAAGIGHRQLERRYRHVVGIGPKLSCTIERFREVIAILHREPATHLGQIAFRAGYADQPHMNRDFKKLTGLSPGAYRRARGLGTTSS